MSHTERGCFANPQGFMLQRAPFSVALNCEQALPHCSVVHILAVTDSWGIVPEVESKLYLYPAVAFLTKNFISSTMACRFLTRLACICCNFT